MLRSGQSRLLFDSVWMNLAEFSARAATLVVGIAVARHLGVGSFAQLTLAQAVVNLALVGGDAGLGVRGVVLVSNGLDPIGVYKHLTARQLGLTLAILGVAVPLATMAAPLRVCLAVGVIPVCHALTANYVLLARSQFRELSTARLFGNLLAIPVWVVGIALGSLFVVALGYAAAAIATATLTNRAGGLSIADLAAPAMPAPRASVSWRSIWSGIYYGAAMQSYSASTVYAAWLLLSRNEFQSIALAWRVLQIFLLPVVAFEAMNWHRLAGHRQRGSRLPSKSFVLFGLLGLVLGVLLALAAGPILHVVYGVESRAAVHALVVMSFALPFHALSSVMVGWELVSGRYVVAGNSLVAAAVSIFAVVALSNTDPVPSGAWAQVAGAIWVVILLMVVRTAREVEDGTGVSR